MSQHDLTTDITTLTAGQKRAARAVLLGYRLRGDLDADGFTEISEALGLFEQPAHTDGHLQPHQRAEQRFAARVLKGAKP